MITNNVIHTWNNMPDDMIIHLAKTLGAETCGTLYVELSSHQKPHISFCSIHNALRDFPSSETILQTLSTAWIT